MADAIDEGTEATDAPASPEGRGKTVHGEAANAGHRVLAPDDAEVEAYLETALNAPAPDRTAGRPATATVDGRPDRRPRLRQPVRPADRAPRPRARRLLRAAARTTRRAPSSSGAARAAIILSGGPNSVYDEGAPKPDPAIWSGRIPVLGICYGAQLMAHELGGDVAPGRPARVRPGDRHDHRATTACSRGIDREQPVWMSHGDSITRLPEGFRATAQTDSTPFAGLADPARNLYGIQFHPEVVHTPRGRDVLRNFVVGIAGVAPDLDAGQLHRHDRRRDPRARRRATPRATGSDGQGHLRPVGRRRLGGRGGARPSRGRRPADLHLRRPRPDAQEGVGAAAGDLRARPRACTSSWSTRASGSSPGWPASRTPSRSAGSSATSSSASSRRRRRKLGRIDFLTQGTLYPDVIESATSETKAAQKIKTHHNVGGLPADLRFQLIEPLRYLFKDEVRAVGLELGPARGDGPAPAVPRARAWRSGSSARSPPSGSTRCARRTGSSSTRSRPPACTAALWQAFAILTPVRSVGVMGDGRTYANVVAIRAVTREDGMTADWAKLPYDVLGKISSAASSTRSRASTGSSTTSRRSRPPRSSGSERREPRTMGYSAAATTAVAFGPWPTN